MCTAANSDATATKVAVTLISWQATAEFYDATGASYDTTGASHDTTAANPRQDRDFTQQEAGFTRPDAGFNRHEMASAGNFGSVQMPHARLFHQQPPFVSVWSVHSVSSR